MRNKAVKIEEVVKYCNYCNTIQWFESFDIEEERPLYLCKTCGMEAYQPQLFKEENNSKL